MIENKKEKIDIEKLGNEKLDLKIDYPEVTEGKALHMLDGTIKEFVDKVCAATYSIVYEPQIQLLEMEALNKNTEKIEKIIDYVVNIDDNALKGVSANKMIYPFDAHWCKKNAQVPDIVSSLEFKKMYLILQLIEWGVNPFKIRICLKSNKNVAWNWEKFMGYVITNSNILDKPLINRSSDITVRCYKARNIIRVMYLFEPLFQNNKDEFDNLEPFNIGFLLPDLSKKFFGCGDGVDVMCFILNYLNEFDSNNKMKDYLLNIPKGYLWENFLSANDDNQSSKENTIISLYNVIVDCTLFDFDEKDFEHDKDFWTLISNLNNDPVLISFFALVAMRKISFTERQMNFIAQKINNQQVINNLRKINQSLDYKIKSINQYGLARRVKLGSVTAILDYAFLKMSRGIGYLGAALFDAILCMLPIGIGGGVAFGAVYLCFSLFSTSLWTTTFWTVSSVLPGALALFLLCYFIKKFGPYLKEKFTKFAGNMERFYDNGKIVNWLELYNIKHPINQIGDPPLNLETGDIPPARTEPYQADSKLTVPNMVGLETKGRNQN